jgi:starvation-inducible outer membrane lipoprotein
VSAHKIALVLFSLFSLLASGCATVPQNRRAHLADPMMSVGDDPLETYRKQKLYNTREGAAGGDGAASGGGCGCQ